MLNSMRCLTVALLASLVAMTAWALPPITPEQAQQLVAYKLESFQATKAELLPGKTPASYRVTGTSKGEAFEAVVDAQVARVMSITGPDGKARYTWPGVLAVGHRGALKFAPENTIPAFNKAIELGADLLEMDVRETKDGHLVVMHDSNVKRMTGQNGAVSQLTLKQIRKLDAGAKFGPEFKGTPIPTFAEVLAAIKGRAIADIDFKTGNPKKLVKAVKKAGMLDKVTLFSENQELLKSCVAIEPGFVTRPTGPTDVQGLDAFIKEMNPSIINMGWDENSPEFVRAAHLAGRLAFVNAMGCEDAAYYEKAIEGGADYIQTDRLDLLVPVLRKHGVHK